MLAEVVGSMRMTQPDREALKRDIMRALDHRMKHGRHLHHRSCIHNLPPDEQIAVRGKTREWYEQYGVPIPIQITSAEWECEPPEFEGTGA